MKRLLTAAFAVTLASSAFAGNSDRYNDNRFDSAVGHLGQTTKAVPAKPAGNATRSSQSQKKPRYADASPFGVGPHNDSR
mgnify:CR=1 FL=1